MATSTLTDLTAVLNNPDALDLIHAVDISDTSPAHPGGKSNKMTVGSLRNSPVNALGITPTGVTTEIDSDDHSFSKIAVQGMSSETLNFSVPTGAASQYKDFYITNLNALSIDITWNGSTPVINTMAPGTSMLLNLRCDGNMFWFDYNSAYATTGTGGTSVLQHSPTITNPILNGGTINSPLLVNKNLSGDVSINSNPKAFDLTVISAGSTTQVNTDFLTITEILVTGSLTETLQFSSPTAAADKWRDLFVLNTSSKDCTLEAAGYPFCTLRQSQSIRFKINPAGNAYGMSSIAQTVTGSGITAVLSESPTVSNPTFQGLVERFSYSGNSRKFDIIENASTTDANTTTIYSYDIPTNKTSKFSLEVIARTNDVSPGSSGTAGQSAVSFLDFTVKNVGGNLSYVTSSTAPIPVLDTQDAVFWTLSLLENGTAIEIEALGDANTNIDWAISGTIFNS